MHRQEKARHGLTRREEGIQQIGAITTSAGVLVEVKSLRSLAAVDMRTHRHAVVELLVVERIALRVRCREAQVIAPDQCRSKHDTLVDNH